MTKKDIETVIDSRHRGKDLEGGAKRYTFYDQGEKRSTLTLTGGHGRITYMGGVTYFFISEVRGCMWINDELWLRMKGETVFSLRNNG